jgi:hypothetical protein
MSQKLEEIGLELRDLNAPRSRREEIKQERERSRAYLLELFNAQEIPMVSTIIRHVTASGMSRDISLVSVNDRGQIVNLAWHIDKVCTTGSLKERNGSRVIRVSGAGMDMGFHIVYNLSLVLYGDGYKLRQEWI